MGVPDDGGGVMAVFKFKIVSRSSLTSISARTRALAPQDRCSSGFIEDLAKAVSR
jgi:hypothetical protein